MNTLIRSILIIIILYLYIYSPPFKSLPFNISLFFTIPTFIMIFRKAKLNFIITTFKIEFLLLLTLCLYSLLLSLINFEFSFFISNVFFIFQLIPVSVWLFYLIEKISIKKNIDFFKILTQFLRTIAIIASLISILGFAYPELGQYFKYSLQKYDEHLWRYQEHRGFGIADELLYSYAIVQGIILILILNTSNNILFNIFCFFLISFSIILNARIGLIVFTFLPVILFRKKSLVKYIIGVLIILLIVNSFNFHKIIDESISIPLEFASSFFLQTGDFLSGSPNADTTYTTLFGSMAIFPDTWYELVFGSGKNIFMDAQKNTDIGYLLMLNFGGLIYFGIFALFIIYIFYRLIKSNNSNPLISYLILFVFIIANIKGLFFVPKPGMKLIMLLYVCFIILNKQTLTIINNESQYKIP